ncbi:MAG TPA: S-layer homology domain-containing protein [Desulfobulbaceae bacterium]|nr:S-layer homology domain-containing protein [Desulfobulbaceae bacterium]
MKKHFLSVLVVLLSITLGACAPKVMKPISAEDSPGHHYLVGMRLVDNGELSQAATHFNRALQLQPDYAPALAGKALTTAMTAESRTDKEHRAVDLKRAVDLLNNAVDKADGNSQKYSVLVTGIRVYTHGKPGNWFNKTQDIYDDAISLGKVKVAELPYYRSREAADYFMGIAAFKDLKFRDAENLLSKVTQAPPGRWHEPANALFKKVHKIVRATAEYTLTNVAKRIAIKDKVVRADVAALLVDEIHLGRLMAGRIPVPDRRPKASFIPADIINSPFRAEIMTILKWRVRGLEPQYDQTTKAYLFHPKAPIKRKELAFILEDLLTKITGKKGLPTAYFGERHSPYPDVPPSAPWFNAVMNVVSRNLMEPGLSGAFRPDAPANGAELLLAVMRLRDAMNIY